MKKTLVAIAAVLASAALSFAQPKAPEAFKPMGDSISNYLRNNTLVRSRVSVKDVVQGKKTLDIYLSDGISDFPIRDKEYADIYAIANGFLPEEYSSYAGKVRIFGGGVALENLKSNFYAAKRDATPVKEHEKYAEKHHRKLAAPLVKNTSKPYSVGKGLQNRHIAMWQSHGFYFEPSLKRWEWQRARCWQTVEDLYTQSYVLPFLVPMLENAGAVVMLPRERDWNVYEQVVDNDDPLSAYRETGAWGDAPEKGFANPKETYTFGENPFKMGTARMAKAAGKDTPKSTVHWIPNIPAASSLTGPVAVYVSYQTVKNSTTAAHYTVKHKGGETTFSVNQQMGGGTWIFLGKFEFEEGALPEQGVWLTNETEAAGSFVTADAVKFGGGMGNIARKPDTDIDRNGDPVEFETLPEVSGYPRFTEGSRYWLQWAGYVDSVYSYSHGVNDYNDDYMSRPRWVNALLGGSYINPKAPGYNIPVDLSFAFHSDAGNVLDDSIIGTLSIYTRLSNDKDTYVNKESRNNVRELADIVQTEIVNDIRASYEPNWARRQLWDRSYAESRIPEVPGMLLELLSHHNLADMRYGLDPSFRFTVSRAIYKGMVKYLAYINNYEYCIQPLPVSAFSSSLSGNELTLSWAPTPDPAEESTVPSGYVVYSRIDEGGFDNGQLVSGTSFKATLEPGHIYSFKVSAVNDGGESFPSEILSAGIVSKDAPVALVVNNFNRVSAPVSFASRDSSYAGFQNGLDSGVPYGWDISFIGPQYEFRRHIDWTDDDSCGFGSSSSDYETRPIAGNTFDYPYIHGKALMAAGYSFISSNRAAVEQGSVSAKGFDMLDVICGKQVTTQVGRKGACELKYPIFTKGIQKLISDYAAAGGNIFISGANIASDLWEPVFGYEVTEEMSKESVEPAKKFVQDVLHYRWMTNQATQTPRFRVVQNNLGVPADGSRFTWQNLPNQEIYCVEAPDALVPVGKGAYTLCRYENTISAAVAYKGDYKVVSLGVPFEVIAENGQLMQLIAGFFKGE